MSRSERFANDLIQGAAQSLVAQTRRVRFQDVDAAGTVFFPKVLEYMSDAYLELLLAAGLDVPGLLERREAAAPLIHAEADYLAPLRFGDEVVVEVVLARIGGSSTVYGYRIRRADDNKVAALGQTVHVWVNARTFTPVPVPDALRQYLTGRAGVTHG